MCAVVLLASVVGCADDLANNPPPGVCDRELTFDVTTVPVEVQYDVIATGASAVQSITYTLPSGEQEVINPALPFFLITTFTAPTSARIRVVGSVATGGEIVVSYLMLPPASEGNFSLCTG
jgi:hypothetical protein